METLIIAEKSPNPAEAAVPSEEFSAVDGAGESSVDQSTDSADESSAEGTAEDQVNAPVDEFNRASVFARARSEAADHESRELALLCAKIADDYRGANVVVLDLTLVTPIFDYFVIATGTSRRQMHAVAEEVDRVLSERGSQRLGIEGYTVSQWIVQDYGDVVLHVFSDEARELYDLETLWADAVRIDWREELGIPTP